MTMTKNDLVQKIKALIEEGRKWTEIARELGLSESVIRSYAKLYLNK